MNKYVDFGVNGLTEFLMVGEMIAHGFIGQKSVKDSTSYTTEYGCCLAAARSPRGTKVVLPKTDFGCTSKDKATTFSIQMGLSNMAETVSRAVGKPRDSWVVVLGRKYSMPNDYPSEPLIGSCQGDCCSYPPGGG